MSDAPRHSRAGHVLFHAVLFLVSAFYFHLGAFSSLEMTDEGLVVYPSWRVAQGALPYRDLQHIYPPAVFFVNGALFAAFGADLAVVRWSLVVLKATLGLLVLFLTRRVASAAAALLAWFLFVAIWGAPIWVFNSPYANHYGLTLGVIALLAFVARPAARANLVATGICLGLAALFKQTLGALYAIAVLCALLQRWQAHAPAERAARGALAALARAVPVAALLAGLAIELAYTARDWHSGSTALLLAPSVLGVLLLGARQLGRAAPAGPRQLGDLLCFGAAVLLPLAGCAAAYAAWGSLAAMVHDTLGDLPHSATWFDPLPVPEARTLANLAAALAALGLLHGLTAAVPHRLRSALWGGVLLAAVALRLQCAPERWGWIGEVFKVLWWTPLLAVCAFLPAILRRRQAEGAAAERDLALAAVWFFAAAALVQLYPAADLPHAGMILPALLPLFAAAADRFVGAPRQARRGGRRLRIAGVIAAAALAVAPLVHAQATAAANRPRHIEGFARASGLWVPGEQFRDAVDLVARLEGETADVFIPANQTLLYFLSGHRSLFDDAEQVLYLVGTGLMTVADARRLLPESSIIARLEQRHPLVVDCEASLAGERFRAAFPAVSLYISDHYESSQRFGCYRLLHHKSGG